MSLGRNAFIAVMKAAYLRDCDNLFCASTPAEGIAIREDLDNLLRRPDCTWMLGHLEMQHLTTTVIKTKSGEARRKRERWVLEYHRLEHPGRIAITP